MMSIGKRLLEQTSGLADAIDKTERKAPANKSAPAQLMAFRGEMQTYEARIELLEAELANARRTAIAVSHIDPNPWQPRTVFDEAEIQELAASIAEVGLIQPVIVRSVASGDTSATRNGKDPSVATCDTRYQLVAGERRLRAHKHLGLSEIRAIVIEAKNDQLATLALAENIAREDLSDFEIATALRRAEGEFPSKKSMAEAIGINRQDLYKYLAFESLPDFVRADLATDPRLLGRSAAAEIQAGINRHGARAIEALSHLWPRVKSADLDQTKLAGLVEAAVLRGETARTERDIRKLFVGKEQAGSITRDANSLTVKIRAAALSPAKEAELRAFVERLLTAG